MKTCLRLMLLLVLLNIWLQVRAGQCAVPAPGTVFNDLGNGVTDISRSDNTGVDDGTNFLGQIRGDQKFLIIRHGKHKADLTVSVGGKLLYTMPDEAVADVEPGWTEKNYDFYLSPEHAYLFVFRGLWSKFAVAYLYRHSGPGRMKPVRPGGLNLDDAAWKHYFTYNKLAENLEFESHMVRFVQWDTARHRLIFTCYCKSFQGTARHPNGRDCYWYTAYDLRTRQFRIITRTQGLPEPQVE